MIESNGILGTLMSQSHTPGRTHLTDKQAQHIKDTLSKHDPNNLTKADAKEIVSSFREAGIRPSIALKQAMSREGFDAKEVVKKAGVRPIKALKEAMLAKGIDAQTVAKNAGNRPIKALKQKMLAEGLDEKNVDKKAEVQPQHPHVKARIKESFNVSENQLSELYKLLHQYHSDDSLDKDRNSLLNSIQEVLGGIEMIGLKQVSSANEANQKLLKVV